MSQSPALKPYNDNRSIKVDYLDGLRGIACLIVVTDHWFTMGFHNPTSQSSSILWHSWFLRTPLRLLIDGGFAVSMFLVLSGYVLLIKFFKKENRGNTSLIYSGMVRRYIRLMVPSFISLLTYYCWLHFGPFQGYSGCHAVIENFNTNSNGTVEFEWLNPSISEVIFNGIVGQYTIQPAIYGIQWTIQIELLGSWIIYCIALMVIKTTGSISTCTYLFIIFLIPFLYLVGLAPLPLQYLQSFIMGMTIANLKSLDYLDLISDFRQNNICTYWMVHITLWILALYFGTFPYQITLGSVETSMWSPFVWMGPWIWLTLASSCVLTSILTNNELQWFLSTKPIKFLGKCSFAVYLLHWIILNIVDIVIMPYLGPATNSHHQNDRTVSALLSYLLIILPSLFVVSYLFTVYVDEPAIELSKDFQRILMNAFPICCRCLHDKDSIIDKNINTDTHGQADVSVNDVIQFEYNMLANHEYSSSSNNTVPMIKQILVNEECSDTRKFTTDLHDDGCSFIDKCQRLLFSFGNKSKKALLIYYVIILLIPCCIPSPYNNDC